MNGSWKNYAIALLLGGTVIGGGSSLFAQSITAEEVRRIVTEDVQRERELNDVKLDSIKVRVEDNAKAIDKMDGKVDQILQRLPARG